MQRASCKSETVYHIYLDLSKSYDSIDRERVVEIMKAYKVGPKIIRYVSLIWDRQEFCLRKAGFYSQTFGVYRGCTQGDTDSPIIFNLIIDAVLRRWMRDSMYRESVGSFYADDGLLESTDPLGLQTDLDIILDIFKKVGLKANASKPSV